MLVESLAQAATVMAMALPEYRDGLGLFAGIDEMRFKRIVRSGETARFEAVVDKMRRGFARVKVRAFVGDELAAEGVIQAIFQPRTATAAKQTARRVGSVSCVNRIPKRSAAWRAVRSSRSSGCRWISAANLVSSTWARSPY